MEGLWNGIPSDQFIETTWMKRGKGPGGIIGDTKKIHKRWQRGRTANTQ